MSDEQVTWWRRFLPARTMVGRAERTRAGAGAMIGLILTGALSHLLLGADSASAYLVAPMGASAVLLFCVPASPLAQPWSVIGGNVVAALIGVACAHSISNPLLAAPVAGCLAILAMFALRCLHPPSGAVALTAVLGGPAVHAAGYQFALLPVGFNSVCIVLAALVYNNLTGRRYPHRQQSVMSNAHETRDPVPTARLGFTREDLDAVIERYGQVLDVSRDDLENIILETEMRAYGRRFGIITCGEIMSRDAITLEHATEPGEAWRLMRRHHVHALPVLDAARRVIGIVAQSDLLRHVELDDYRTLGARLRRLIGDTLGANAGKPEQVGQIMSTAVKTVLDSTPIVELVPLMANTGLHHIPVVDAGERFVGIVTQSDLVAALYESRLSHTA